MPSLCESGETEEAEWEEVAGDYVFRIVNNAITDREGKLFVKSLRTGTYFKNVTRVIPVTLYKAVLDNRVFCFNKYINFYHSTSLHI